jgi:hypothetical protein
MEGNAEQAVEGAMMHYGEYSESEADYEYGEQQGDVLYNSSDEMQVRPPDDEDFDRSLLALQSGADPSTMVCYTAVRKGVCDKPGCPFLHAPAELEVENARMIKELRPREHPCRGLVARPVRNVRPRR